MTSILDALSPRLRETLAASSVLVIGTGGIGCELLKNLVKSGFGHIEALDLDVIDVSNLNRQFLFRRSHVGMPKSRVACEAARNMAASNTSIVVKSHVGPLQNPTFSDPTFLLKYDMVLNALDNIEARKHANRLCAALGIPVIESGTAGFLGQTQPMIYPRSKAQLLSGEPYTPAPGFECFECVPKGAAQKSFPVCVLKANPSKMVHCAHWALATLNGFFSTPNNPVLKALADPEFSAGNSSKVSSDVGGNAENEDEWVTWRPPLINTSSDEELAMDLGRQLFDRDIRKLVELTEIQAKKDPGKETRWAQGLPPRPLFVDGFGNFPSDVAKREWQSFVRACSRLLSVARTGSLSFFDKDDETSMEWVAAASNLRAIVFHLPPESHFAIKGIAGNIIPAVASANAIVAGAMVMEALKMLASQTLQSTGITTSRLVACVRTPATFKRKPCVLVPSRPGPVNKSCVVCQRGSVVLMADLGKMTLGAFVEKVCKQTCGFNVPMVSTERSIIYDAFDVEDDEDSETAQRKSLLSWGIHAGSFMVIEDGDAPEKVLQVLCGHTTDPCDGEFRIVGNVTCELARSADWRQAVLQCRKNELLKQEREAEARRRRIADASSVDLTLDQSTVNGSCLDLSDDVAMTASASGPSRKRDRADVE
eukprot:ANDGO_07334.mRNA.1 SUMO-activating enzyme subunit 2